MQKPSTRCGDDLIQLINDILDLSKIESGFISANISPSLCAKLLPLWKLHSSPFRKQEPAVHHRDRFKLAAAMETDIQRLNQILKNLLSNSFKFTEKGEVKLRIYEANKNWKQGNQQPRQCAERWLAFAISDTGIGISKEKQNIIFEAFQQAEGSTSRKYGGTGLGLSISRGLADLLGGTIELESQSGKGSTFTLFLPVERYRHTVQEKYPKTLKVYQQLQLGTDTGEIDTLLDNLRITNEGIDEP